MSEFNDYGYDLIIFEIQNDTDICNIVISTAASFAAQEELHSGPGGPQHGGYWLGRHSLWNQVLGDQDQSAVGRPQLVSVGLETHVLNLKVGLRKNGCSLEVAESSISFFLS